MEETRRLGRELARSLRRGSFVALSGPLGAGKTTFVRGVAEGLGADPSAVSSPTFVLLHVYHGRLPVYHLDAYRLREAREMREVGLSDLVEGDGVVLLEWAERTTAAVPDDAIWVRFENLGDDVRLLTLSSTTRSCES